MSRCPSDLALEAHLLEPAGSAVAPHVADCLDCQHRVARMEREGEDFRRFVFPATVGAVEDAAAPRRRLLPAWLAPVAGLAAAAAALVLVVNTGRLGPGGPAPDYVGTKGGPAAAVAAGAPEGAQVKGPGLMLGVFVQGATGVSAVSDGAAVPAAAGIRFKVQAAAPGCRLWIASVDAAGQVSRIFPASGDPVPVSRGELPGGARLDGLAGPERIYAVCAPEALPWDRLEQAVHAAADGGEARVRGAGLLGGLPAGASQTTLLLEKRP